MQEWKWVNFNWVPFVEMGTELSKRGESANNGFAAALNYIAAHCSEVGMEVADYAKECIHCYQRIARVIQNLCKRSFSLVY